MENAKVTKKETVSEDRINKDEIVTLLNLLKVSEQVYFRAIYPKDDKCEKYGIQKASERHKLWNEERDRCQKFTTKKDVIKYIDNGYNIYFVVNNGGNTKQQITSCPAIFCEFDDIPKDKQLERVKNLMPEPSLIIDSGNKSLHFYWIFNNPITPSEWETLQLKLINFVGSDPTIKDLPRVMRLAGCKAQETGNLSTIVEFNDVKYNPSDFDNIFAKKKGETNLKDDISLNSDSPSHSNKTVKKNSLDFNYLDTFDLPLDISIDLLAAIAPSTENYVLSGVTEGQRNDIGFKNVISFLLGTAKYLDSLGQKYDHEPLHYLQIYARNCTPPLPEFEVNSIFDSALKSGSSLCLSEEQVKSRIYSRYKDYIKSTRKESLNLEKGKKRVQTAIKGNTLNVIVTYKDEALRDLFNGHWITINDNWYQFNGKYYEQVQKPIIKVI